MMTAEDQLASAMVPRLIAAGADLERVHFMQAIKRDAKTDAMFLLGEDIAELEAYLRDHPAVGIVRVDPITAFLGHAKGFDSHRATDVRSQLGPLKDAAERTGVVFSAVTHPPIHRLTGFHRRGAKGTPVRGRDGGERRRRATPDRAGVLRRRQA
jgi:hypothetical protein